MSKSNNSRVLAKGFADFNKAISNYIEDSLEDSALELFQAVARNRTFIGFTGNTQTSYACGIYVNGQCKRIVFQKNWMQPPLRMKIRYGERVWLNEPYEGRPRGVRGVVDITDNYGQETSLRFLLEYKCPKDGWGLVMTTGTEYSEFLETIYGYDVLTATGEEAYGIISKNFKPMPSEWQ